MVSHRSIRGTGTGMPSSVSKDCNHESSATVFAKALYSASVLDRATVACFLQLQEMRLLLKKTQYPLVER
jgi:hypothetical protein